MSRPANPLRTRRRMPRSALLTALAVAALLPAPLIAQDKPAPPERGAAPRQPAPAPQAEPPAPGNQPAVDETDGRAPLAARVIEVNGDVQHAPMGSREWTPCKVDDEYPEKTKIRTGVRSSIKLQIGQEEPYTVMVIESVGLTVLSEAYKTGAVKRVRVGVGYGGVRAGVAEGGLQSDFTIDTPVATLSKRGTWNFGIYYERTTGRFEAFLLDRGLVDVLNKLRGQTRRLQPGQLVTQAMRRWADEAQIRRNVSIVDLFGQGDVDVAFNRIRNDGLGVLDPGSGNKPLLNLSSQFAQREFGQMLMQNIAAPIDLTPGGGERTPVFRPEGFFGTGRGDELIPVLIDPNNALVKRGLARPGTYRIRRSAAEDWLRSTGKK